MGHGKLTDLTSKEEQRPKEVVVSLELEKIIIRVLVRFQRKQSHGERTRHF